MQINTYSDSSEWVQGVIKHIVSLSEKAIQESGQFNIVLSGGSTPQLIYQQLRDIRTEWKYWKFWIADERMPVDNFNDFNSTMIFDYLFNYIPITKEQVNFISVTTDVNTATQLYIERLAGVGIFDLALLGVGEDGHTASLFPGNNWGLDHNSPDVIDILNSPKLSSQRVSLSAKRLMQSNSIFYIAKGIGKKDVIDQILTNENLPISIIRGFKDTTLYYCLQDL